MCELLPSLTPRTRVVLIMHKYEVAKTTNTGRLALLCLTNAELFIRGDQANPLDGAALVPDTHQPLLLYPSPRARVLDRDFVLPDERPVCLLVPDGNWGQAARVGRRVAALADVPHVVIPPGPPSAYRLRKTARPGALCTIEAIARALGVLDGPKFQSELERALGYMVARTLAHRRG